MVDDLKQAIELAERCPDEEQRVIAHLMIEEIHAEQRWTDLFADPRSERVLEAMAAEALSEDLAGETEDISGNAFA